jgi:DNA (cytosine-5)-methyltransferase 1
MTDTQPTYYEFFAGGGMARAGLGPGWKCLFANDFDPMKAATYSANWGKDDLVCGDVAKLVTADLPDRADLAWASFPCQDLSLAGDYAGLGRAASTAKTRSGTFWPFWALMRALRAEGRSPRMIVLENVYGAITSREGKDFGAICSALANADYRFGALVLDALWFVPQSRPRVFFIAVEAGCTLPSKLQTSEPSERWHPRALLDAYQKLAPAVRGQWLWWHVPQPAKRNSVFADLIEDEPMGVEWHSRAETAHLLRLMSSLNRSKLKAARASGRRMVGGVYRRTRPDEKGAKRQRAEVRFDDVAGCLRTPRGGSSRQTILIVEGNKVRSRLLSPREAARLMGLPDEYKLPSRYNDAYHVAGDGVCVPVVRYIAECVLEPILAAQDPLPELLAAE